LAEQRRLKPVRYSARTVISAAQNYEDVLLNRVFDKEEGFYIDIGAGDPNADSVTKWFYELGWRGINIEPNPIFIPIYAQCRPQDINLQIGIGREVKEMPFYRVHQNDIGHGWGLSSLKLDYATRATALGFKTDALTISVVPLQDVINKYVSKPVDFLKIDVEGAEFDVLADVDFQRFRPTVICIEAIQPEHGIPSHQEWEQILIRYGYIFALFDGVNAFYLKEESAELLPQFNSGVNVHDRFRRQGPEAVNLPQPRTWPQRIRSRIIAWQKSRSR
jgi:FkbM family methyltransferase